MHNHVLGRVPADDRGDIIGSWLIRVTLGLAVAGVVLFDAISIGSAKVSLEDTAHGAAREAVEAVEATPTQPQAEPVAAYAAAQTYAGEQNHLNQVDPQSLRLGADGAVTLTVERTAPTLVVQRVRWISDWAVLSATATAAPVR